MAARSPHLDPSAYPTVASFIVTWSRPSLCMRGVRQVLREGGIKNIRLRGWAWPAVESRLLMAKEKLSECYFGADREQALDVMRMIEADLSAGMTIPVLTADRGDTDATKSEQLAAAGETRPTSDTRHGGPGSAATAAG